MVFMRMKKIVAFRKALKASEPKGLARLTGKKKKGFLFSREE